MKITRYPILAIMAGVGLAAATAHAGIFSWNSGTGGGNWTNAAKWTPAGGPPGTTDTVVFLGVASNYTSTLLSDMTVGFLSVTPSNNIYVTNTAAASKTFTATKSVELLASTGNTSAVFHFSGFNLVTPTILLSGGILQFDKPTDQTLSSAVIFNGIGTTGGSLRLGGTTTFTGPVTVNSGASMLIRLEGGSLGSTNSQTTFTNAVTLSGTLASGTSITFGVSTAATTTATLNLNWNNALTVSAPSKFYFGNNANTPRNGVMNLQNAGALGDPAKMTLYIDGSSTTGTANLQVYLDGAFALSNSVVLAGSPATSSVFYVLGGKNLAGTTATWAGVITAGGTVNPGFTAKSMNAGAELDFTGGITLGGRKITVEGPGTVRFSASNSYSGGTLLNSGILIAGHSAAFGSGAVTLAGGTLDLTAYNIGNTINITGTGASVRLPATTGVMHTNFAGGSLYQGWQRISSTGASPTTASLLDGSASLARTLTSAWTNDAHGATNLKSGVFDVKGTGSDPFVLQMSSTAALAATDYLGWYNTGSSKWVNALTGNSTNPATFITVTGDYASWRATHIDPLSNYLDVYGVDTANHAVWAVVNHNSEFAVVPEPAMLALFGLGGGVLLRRRRSPLERR